MARSPRGPCTVRLLDCSRRALVLVQEPSETVATLQRYRLRPGPRRRCRPTIRRCQVQAAMRPPTVVMINELGEHARQMPRVQDQEPIQAF